MNQPDPDNGLALPPLPPKWATPDQMAAYNAERAAAGLCTPGPDGICPRCETHFLDAAGPCREVPRCDVRALLAGKRHEPRTGPQWEQATAGAAACDADYPGGNVKYGDALIGANRYWRAAYELRYHELLALRPPGGAS